MQNHYFDATASFHPYVGSLDAREGSIAPDNALRVDLPFAFTGDGTPKKENVPSEYKGFWPCEEDGIWILAEDHRGEQGYVDGKSVTIKDVGPLPDGWSDTPPPQPFHPGPDYEKQEDGTWLRIRYTRKDFMLWCGIDKLMQINAAIAEGNVMVETIKDLLMAAEYISIKDPDTVQMAHLLASPQGGSILTPDDVARILAGQVWEGETEAA